MASLGVAERKEIGFLSINRLSCLHARYSIFTNGDLFVTLDLDQRRLLVCLFGVDYDFVSISSRQDIVGFPTKQKKYLKE